MTKPSVATFLSTYNNQVLERRFGEAFADTIELDDEYVFTNPNVADYCYVADYMITCHDN